MSSFILVGAQAVYIHNGTTTPAQLATKLQSLISGVRGQLTSKEPSIVLIVPYDLSNFGSSRPQYASAIRAVTTADPTVGLVDLTSMGVATPGGLWASDGLHPSDTGHASMAHVVLNYLTAQH